MKAENRVVKFATTRLHKNWVSKATETDSYDRTLDKKAQKILGKMYDGEITDEEAYEKLDDLLSGRAQEKANAKRAERQEKRKQLIQKLKDDLAQILDLDNHPSLKEYLHTAIDTRTQDNQSEALKKLKEWCDNLVVQAKGIRDKGKIEEWEERAKERLPKPQPKPQSDTQKTTSAGEEPNTESKPKRKTKGKWHTVGSAGSREDLQASIREHYHNKNLVIEDDGTVRDPESGIKLNSIVRNNKGRWQLGRYEEPTSGKADITGTPNTDTSNVVSEKDLTPAQKLLVSFGKKLGVEVVFFYNKDSNFRGVHKEGKTFLNINGNKELGGVFWHESLHWLRNNNQKLYQELVKAAGITDAQRQAYLEETGRTDITTPDEINEEILADMMDDVTKRTGLFQSIAGKNRGLIERVIQWFKDTLNKFIDHFRNPQGKLTTAQAQALADEFGRIANQFKDPNGNQIFRYNRRTHNVELADGREWSDAAIEEMTKKTAHHPTKLSGEQINNIQNSVDNENNFYDNEDTISERVFGKFLTDGIMKMVKTTVEKEIGEYVDISKMGDPVTRDDARDKLPCIRQMLTDYNLKYVQNNEAYKNRLATKIEYARRCFDNDERIRNEIIRQMDRDQRQRGIRDARTSTVSGSNASRTGRQLRERQSGIQRKVSGGKSSARKHFEKLYDEEAKRQHSERQGAFYVGTQDSRADKPKFSIGADNSSKSLLQRIRDKATAFIRKTPSPSGNREKRIAEKLKELSGYRIAFGHLTDKDDDIIVNDLQKIIRSKHAYDWEKILPVVGSKIAKSLNLDATPEMSNCIADWFLTGTLDSESAEAKAFQNAARENPAMLETLSAVRDIFKEIADMTPSQYYRSKIVSETPKTLLQRLGIEGSVTEELIDDLDPIKQAVDKAIEKAPDKETADLIKKEFVAPYKLSRLMRGKGEIANIMLGSGNAKTDARDIEKIRAALKEQYPFVDFSNFKTLTMIIDEAGGKAKLADFEAFCVAMLDKEMYDKNRANPDGIQYTPLGTEKQADALIKAGKAQFGQAQKDLVAFSNTAISMLYTAGCISKTQYYTAVNAWKNYVPMVRVFDENEDYNFVDSLKHKSGSKRDVRSPIESIILNAQKMIQQAERNKVKLELATLARLGAFGNVIDEVETSNPNVDTIITFRENGKLKRLETPDVAFVRAVNSVRSSADGAWVVKMFKATMNIMRNLYTTLSPEFVISNTFRDASDAFIHNKHAGWNPVALIAEVFKNCAKLLFKPLDQDFYEWRAYGGSQSSFVSEDVDYAERKVGELTGRGNFFSKTLDKLQKLAEYSETATRLTTYKTSKAALAKTHGGETTVNDKRLAALESRDASVDFARAGKSTRIANRGILFLNAAVQSFALWGKDLTLKNLKTKEGQRLLATKIFKAALLGMMGTALQFALNYWDEDRWKKYKNRHDWEKNTYWIFGDGVRIPKGRDFGMQMLSTMTDEFLGWAFANDPVEARRFAKTIADAAPSITATLITPAVEAYVNYSIFRDAPIVPLREQRLSPQNQYGVHTSPVAKIVGETLGISPRKLDYLISGYLGFWGRMGSLNFDELPILRRFSFDPYKNPRIVQDYYAALEQQTKYDNDYKLTKKAPDGYDRALYNRLKAARKQMQQISAQERKLLEDPKISSSDRKTKLLDLEKRRIALCERIFKPAQ